MATEVSFAKTFLAILDKQPQKITADHVEDPRNYPASTPYTLPRLSTSKPMSKRGSSKSKTTSTTTSSTATEPSPAAVTVTIKSPRNPTLELTLPTPQPLATTSMLDIKNAIYEQTCLPVDKLKILYNKKPVADTKTIKDALGGGSSLSPEGNTNTVEFSLMVMGGVATAAAAAEALAAKQAQAAQSTTPAPETKAEVEVQADADGDTVMTSDEQQQQQQQAQQAQSPHPPPVVAEGSGPSGAAVLKTEEFWEDLKGFLQQRIRDVELAEEVVGKFRAAVV